MQIVAKDSKGKLSQQDRGQERMGLTFWNFCHPGVETHASDIVYDPSTDSFFQWTGETGT